MREFKEGASTNALALSMSREAGSSKQVRKATDPSVQLT